MSKITRFARTMSVAMMVMVLAACPGDVTPPEDPSLNISPSDVDVTLTKFEGETVTFTAKTTGGLDAEATRWSVDGESAGTGSRFSQMMKAGEYEVCGLNSGLTSCATAFISWPEFEYEWYDARPGSSEVLAEGTEVVATPVFSDGVGTQDIRTVSGGMISVRPPATSALEGLRLCRERGVYPRCVIFEREELFSSANVIISVTEGWRIEKGSYAGHVDDVPWEKVFERSGKDATAFHYISVYVPLSQIPPVVIVMDSLSQTDANRIREGITRVFGHLGWGEPSFVANGPDRDACNSFLIKGRRSGAGGTPTGCDQSRLMQITGGTVYVVPSSTGTTRVIEHEFVHALSFGHTNSWPSLQNDNPTGWGGPTLTPTDVAKIHAMYRVLELIDKYGSQVEWKNTPMHPWTTF